MARLDAIVKYHLAEIDDLITARAARRRFAFPEWDIRIRIWWHIRRIRAREAVING